MAVIECFVRKGYVNLGFIKIVDGKPYYDFEYTEATHMPLEDAIKLVEKLSFSYLFQIHRDKTDIKKETSHYIIL